MNYAQLVKSSIAKRIYMPVEQIRGDMTLADVALDSFALVELLIELEETSGVHLAAIDLADLRTVADLTALIERGAAIGRQAVSVVGAAQL